MSEQWTTVDNYLVELLTPEDEALSLATTDADAAGLPPIAVAPNQGTLLEILVRSLGAKRILEIGTLGGYSTICLARGLSSGGTVVTLELEGHHATVARANVDRAGVGELVDIRVGPAGDSLAAMVADATEPFDFIFIDANKEGYPGYLDPSIRLSHSGTMIFADNIVRKGEVVNADSTDELVIGVRTFLEMVAADKRVRSTAIQTVGSKGLDGFALLVVL